MINTASTENKIRDSFTYQFPAIRGIQAGREYYVTMCPLKLIPKIFLFNENEIPPKLRAQRKLNRARIPQICNYMVNNPKNYIFSALTASIDGKVHFEPYGDKGPDNKVGTLIVSMTARFIINDGQHRRAAIEEALKKRPELGMDTISVVLFLDEGLKRSQQMFADLNKHAIKPTRSLGILYDNRDPLSQLVISLTDSVPIFKGLTDFEKTTISNRSSTMFTLSSIYQATRDLLKGSDENKDIFFDKEKIAVEYWSEVTKNIPEWENVIEKKVSPNELRRDFLHAHGVVLHALGILGNSLILTYPDTWKDQLQKLQQINWSRSNTVLWEGRAMIGGRISKATMNLILTSSLLKQIFGLPLTPEEERAEENYNKALQERINGV